MTQDDFARFWSKVRLAGGCWEWQAGRNSNGYGYFWLLGRQQRAHIVAFALANGYRPRNRFVCHTCDNRRCVNPAHLYDGTPFDNAADRDSRGRNKAPIGEQHGRCKVTDKDVQRIRQARGTMREIAARFDLSPMHVWRIRAFQRRQQVKPKA